MNRSRLPLTALRSFEAAARHESFTRAAEELNLTQGAISHQIKGLEDQAGVELFVRRSKPLKLSAAGHRMLRLAERILPQIDALEAEFEALEEGSAGRLHIALECHACYDWLFPVLEQFRRAWPDVDIDIRAGRAFDALAALRREEVDVVISSDPEEEGEAQFAPLFDYSPVFIGAADHPLAAKPWIEAADLEPETLLCYPVDRSRLDVYKMLLHPAGVEPAAYRQVELTQMILMLVASGRGVAVLPDWVMNSQRNRADFAVRRLTESGVTRRMYAASRADDAAKPYMAHFVRLARTEAVKLQRG